MKLTKRDRIGIRLSELAKLVEQMPANPNREPVVKELLRLADAP